MTRWGRARCAAILACLLLGWAGQGVAGSPDVRPVADGGAKMPDADTAGIELTRLFDQFCLQRFPQQADLSAGQGGMTPLLPDQVREFLHDDPGRGWVIRGAGAPIVVTVEDPPFRACAVRRFYQSVPGYEQPFQALIESWAVQQRRGPFQPARTLDQARPTMDIHATVQTLPAQGPRWAEVHMAFRTRYPSGAIEIRLVRQIPRPDLLGK